MRRHPRSLLAAALCALCFMGVGCGGSQSESAGLVELPPADPEAVREFVAGVRLMSRRGAGNARRARQKFERALSIDPLLWEAHYNLGVVHYRAGRLDAAAASLEEAHRIQPRAAEPLFALAEVEQARDEGQAATRHMRRAIELDPDHLDARIALAMILRGREQYGRALEQAREVLIRDSTHVPALLEVGRVYRARRQWDVAALVFQKALALTSEAQSHLRAEIQNELGLLELGRGDTQAAFQAFGEATVLDPGFTAAHMNEGSVLLLAGNYAGAEVEYRAVLAQEPENADAMVALGITLRGQDNPRQARRLYRQALGVAPNHLDALFNMGVLQAEFLDERRGARRRFVRFLQLAPSGHPKRELAQRYLEDIPAPPGQESGDAR